LKFVEKVFIPAYKNYDILLSCGNTDALYKIFNMLIDPGDFVIVVNADKVKLTGNKLDKKFYYSHSGIPGGFQAESYRHLLARKPEFPIEKAVKGMLPKGVLGREMITKLDDFLRRRSKIALVVSQDKLRESAGLREACRILFGDEADAKFAEYFAERAANAA